MDFGPLSEKDVKDFHKGHLSLTRKLSILRHLFRTERKIRLKRESAQGRFQRPRPGQTPFLRKRKDFRRGNGARPERPRKEGPRALEFLVTKKAKGGAEPRNGESAGEAGGPPKRRSRVTLEQGPPVQSGAETSPSEKAEAKSLFAQFVGSAELRGSPLKDQSPFAFIAETLPRLRIESVEQFKKYLSVVSLNLKARASAEEKDGAEESAPGEAEPLGAEALASHPLALLAEKMVSAESLSFEERLELLRALSRTAIELYSDLRGADLVAEALGLYFAGDFARSEILANWGSVKAFVKESGGLTASLISSVAGFEMAQRPDSCLTVELALETEDKALRAQCLRSAVEFADKSVFAHVKEHFLDSPLFAEVVVPAAKDQFLAFKRELTEAESAAAAKPSREHLQAQRKVGPLVFCTFYERSLLDFLWAELPGAHAAIQGFFLKQLPRLFGQCVTDKGLLFKYFKGVVDILGAEPEPGPDR